MKSISLYIHIPFCESKCKYCDFFSKKYSRSLADDYVNVLAHQIEQRAKECRFKTVYIGGGTPSMLSLQQLEKLLKSIVKYSDGFDFNHFLNRNNLEYCYHTNYVARFGRNSYVDRSESFVVNDSGDYRFFNGFYVACGNSS